MDLHIMYACMYVYVRMYVYAYVYMNVLRMYMCMLIHSCNHVVM